MRVVYVLGGRWSRVACPPLWLGVVVLAIAGGGGAGSSFPCVSPWIRLCPVCLAGHEPNTDLMSRVSCDLFFFFLCFFFFFPAALCLAGGQARGQARLQVRSPGRCVQEADSVSAPWRRRCFLLLEGPCKLYWSCTLCWLQYYVPLVFAAWVGGEGGAGRQRGECAAQRGLALASTGGRRR